MSRERDPGRVELAEPPDAVDWAGSTASRASQSFQPARQLVGIVIWPNAAAVLDARETISTHHERQRCKCRWRTYPRDSICTAQRVPSGAARRRHGRVGVAAQLRRLRSLACPAGVVGTETITAATTGPCLNVGDHSGGGDLPHRHGRPSCSRKDDRPLPGSHHHDSKIAHDAGGTRRRSRRASSPVASCFAFDFRSRRRKDEGDRLSRNDPHAAPIRSGRRSPVHTSPSFRPLRQRPDHPVGR